MFKKDNKGIKDNISFEYTYCGKNGPIVELLTLPA